MSIQMITPGPRPSALVAAEVRAELGRQGLSMRQLALRLGVNQMWLQRRISLTGNVDLTFEEIVDMAEALHVPVQRLLATWLPRLDSNQQPSGYLSAQVVDLAARRAERAA